MRVEDDGPPTLWHLAFRHREGETQIFLSLNLGLSIYKRDPAPLTLVRDLTTLEPWRGVTANEDLIIDDRSLHAETV